MPRKRTRAPRLCRQDLLRSLLLWCGVNPKINLIAQKNPDLWKPIIVYQSQRERAGLAEVEHKVGYGELKSEIREQMVVNADVMIREHFLKRLRLYTQLRFGRIDDTMTTTQKADKKHLVNAILRACYNTEDTELVEALEIRDVLTPDGSKWREQWIPWPNHIKENGMGFYIRPLCELLDVVEHRMKEEPNEKGVRRSRCSRCPRRTRAPTSLSTGRHFPGFTPVSQTTNSDSPRFRSQRLRSEPVDGRSCGMHSTSPALKS